MIRHLLVWKSADEGAAARVHAQLVALVARASYVRDPVVARHTGLEGPRTWKGLLSCDFTSEEDLNTFMASADHVEVVGAIRPLLTDVAMIDVRLQP